MEFKSLKELEIEAFKRFLSDEQKKYISALVKEGYEYLLYGNKFVHLQEERYRRRILELGYDPDFIREVCVPLDDGITFKLFFLKPLVEEYVTKEAFMSEKRKNKYAMLLRSIKEEFHDMEMYELGDELYERLDFLGFKEGIVSKKCDGEMNIMVYDRDWDECKLFSKSYFIRYDIPLTKKMYEYLKKNGYKKAVLLGEVYARDPAGKKPFIPFSESMDIFKKPDTKEEEDLLSFYIYDVISLDDKKLYPKVEYSERVKLIDKVFRKTKYFSPFAYEVLKKEEIADFFEEAVEEGWEGVVIYFKTSEGDDKFIKIKRSLDFDVGVMAGIKGTGKYKKTLGALVCVFKDKEGNYRLAGKVGTGFTDEDRDFFWNWIKKNRAKSQVRKKDDWIFVKPKLVIQAKCLEVDVHPDRTFRYSRKEGWVELDEKLMTGIMRMPRFQRIREDKTFDYQDIRITQVPQIKY
jgi:ATP-dependent DNA ligase